MRRIYFDYNATTPLDQSLRSAMLPFLGDIFGNPSSIHQIGRVARSALDDARDRVATVWRCKPSEVVFTSGGTESNNMAIFGAARALAHKGRHLITSRIEHHAVLHCFQYLEKKEGFDVTYLPSNSEGVVSLDDLERAVRTDTILVSIMAANNETGSVQPVAEFGRICRNHNIIFHTDAVQWFGKMPFQSIGQFNADLVSFCAHKLHGPKGAGALYIKSPFNPDPLIFGGSHENERRAGTENVASIIGLAESVERFVRQPVFPTESLLTLTKQLRVFLVKLDGVQVRGSQTERLPNTVSCTVSGTDSIALLAGLDLAGVCVSSGSACSAGSLEPSHVLIAMGVAKEQANSLVRFSLGRESTVEELLVVQNAFENVIKRIRGS